jgi:hypothetical protein
VRDLRDHFDDRPGRNQELDGEIGRELMVVGPGRPPARHPAWQAPVVMPAKPPSLLGHYLTGVKDRIRLRIDGQTARIASAAVRDQTEQLRLMNEYHSAINASRLADLERQVKAAELQQRMEQIATQQWENQQLQALRVHRERLAIRLEIATLRRQLQELRQGQPVQLTPAQQRLVKKAEIEEQMQQLRIEEDRAVQRAIDDLEKRRLQNMYNGRREQLTEQLEKFI